MYHSSLNRFSLNIDLFDNDFLFLEHTKITDSYKKVETIFLWSNFNTKRKVFTEYILFYYHERICFLLNAFLYKTILLEIFWNKRFKVLRLKSCAFIAILSKLQYNTWPISLVYSSGKFFSEIFFTSILWALLWR